MVMLFTFKLFIIPTPFPPQHDGCDSGTRWWTRHEGSKVSVTIGTHEALCFSYSSMPSYWRFHRGGGGSRQFQDV